LNAGNPGASCSASDESLILKLTSKYDATAIQNTLSGLNLPSLSQNPSSR
jgi:hypothetical protein